MQGAAMGLTCRDAMAIFSEKETLALQRRVSELEEELAGFKPHCTFHDKHVHASALMDRIKTRFEALYPRETRYKPVRDEGDALYAFGSVHGDIWSGFHTPYEGEHHSLMGIVMEELVSALGDSCWTYCNTQCDNISNVLSHALRAGYIGGGWLNFQQQDLQELIVWNVLRKYLTELVMG